MEGVPTATPMWKRPAQAQAASRASNLRPAESTPSGPAQPAGSVGPPRSIASAPQAGESACELRVLQFEQMLAVRTCVRPASSDIGWAGQVAAAVAAVYTAAMQTRLVRALARGRCSEGAGNQQDSAAAVTG